MKHILVIERFSVCHKRLKDRYGCKLTLILEKQRIKPHDKNIYDRIIGIGNNAPDEEWMHIVYAINNIDKIDGILCLTESKQVLAARIAKTLGICYNSEKTVILANDKLKMRKHLLKEGLSNLKYRAINDRTDAISFFRDVNTDIILKPYNGRGSDSIHRISSEDDIMSLPEDIFKGMIAEVFAQGEEFSVEAISYAGKHKIMCITKKIKDEATFVEIGHIVPANVSSESFSKIADYVSSVLTSMNVESGVTHTEIMVCENRIEIIETHLRFGGDYIPELISEIADFDLIEFQILTTLNNQIDIERFFEWDPLKIQDNKGFASVRFKFFSTPGVITDIKNTPCTENDSDIVLVIPDAVGDRVANTKDSFSRGMMVVVKNSDYEVCLKKAQDLVESTEYVIN